MDRLLFSTCKQSLPCFLVEKRRLCPNHAGLGSCLSLNFPTSQSCFPSSHWFSECEPPFEPPAVENTECSSDFNSGRYGWWSLMRINPNGDLFPDQNGFGLIYLILEQHLLLVVFDLLYEWLLIVTKSSAYTLTLGVHQVYHKAKTQFKPCFRIIYRC